MKALLDVDDETGRQIRASGVIPVVTVTDPGCAGPLANALKTGGLAMAEVTLRTRAAVEVLSRIAADPEFAVGAGTVITPEQVDLAREAGARFVVCPGVSEPVVYRCRELGLLPIPGVCTATDVIAALDLGCGLLKFFPAHTSGGVATLHALHGPFPTVSFIATGGISPANLADYLALPFVAAVGGAGSLRTRCVDQADFGAVTQVASQAVALASEARR